MDKRNEEQNIEKKLTARYLLYMTLSTSKTLPGEQLHAAWLLTGARGQRHMHVGGHPPYT